MSKKDLRLKILEHFNNLKRSTAETNTNEWLYQQHTDLGTIRRAVIELIETDMLAISEKDKEEALTWIKEVMDSTTRGFEQERRNAKKSSKRLIASVGEFPEIPNLKIYTTLKGILFIQDYKRTKNLNINKLVFMILGVLLGMVVWYIKEIISD